MAWPTGMIIPPPSPCSTRNTISSATDPASPHSSEPSMKAASETSQTRLAPNRSLAHPVSGITLAKASR
jgi:hypothetical protein